MKRIIKTKIGLSLLTLAITVLGLSVLNAASVSAWGPERPTFTMEEPASYPTFNSITNNPTIEDERNFVRVGQINADVTELTDTVEVVPGHQYLVYIYFHNNASSTYNDAAHNFAGIAMQTRMSTSFSTVITPESRGTITATITAENSNPTSVWDEAYMTTSTEKVLLHYVPGSAKIYNDWAANGSVMPSSLFTEGGTLIGLNGLNGVIPGCEEYHGVVSYVLQAEELGGAVNKTVSKDGNDYTESVEIKPGEEAYFKLAIVNTGDVELTNATIKDTLPNGLTLVPGSVELSANDSSTRDPLSDNLIVNGYNLGTIGTGNTVYIYYRAQAGSNFDCTGSSLINTARLTYDSEVSSGDSKEDTATVIVRRDDCEPTPEENCDTNPTLPGCTQDCTTNPSLPECNNCETNPNLPGCSTPETCETNPELPGCELPDEIPSTGPLEIVLACVIVLGIAGAGFYLYRTKRVLKTVEGEVTGKATSADMGATQAAKDAKDTKDTKDSNPKEGSANK